MKTFILALALIKCLAVIAEEEASFEVPEDAPLSEAVVFHPTHSFRKTLEIDAEVGHFYGDRFLSSWAYGLQSTYFLTEKTALQFEILSVKNSLDDGSFDLLKGNSPILMHNPSQIFRLAFLWQPLYGKFVVGNHIQHFVWNISIGGHLSNEEIYGYQEAYFLPDATRQEPETIVLEKKILFGPNISTKLSFPLSKSLSLAFVFEYFLNTTIDSSEGVRRLWFTGLNAGVKL